MLLLVTPLSIAASTLLVSWTDPRTIVAASVAAGIVILLAMMLSRREEASAPSSVDELKERAKSGQDTQADAANAAEATPPGQEAEQEDGAEAGAGAEKPENLAAGRGRTLAEMAAHEEIDNAELISRFVLNGQGETVGETVTVTEEQVILKRDGTFFAIEPDTVIEKNGTLLADANIDWEEAEQAGEQWREANMDRMEYDEHGMPVTN